LWLFVGCLLVACCVLCWLFCWYSSQLHSFMMLYLLVVLMVISLVDFSLFKEVLICCCESQSSSDKDILPVNVSQGYIVIPLHFLSL